MGKVWKNEYEYQRVLQILDDYWVTEPDELKVRITMDFIKSNGHAQSKVITWVNPNYTHKSVSPLTSMTAQEIAELEIDEDDFYDITDLIPRETRT